MTSTERPRRGAIAEPAPQPRVPDGRLIRRLAIAATLASAVLAALALTWYLAPSLSPLGSEQLRSVGTAVLGAEVASLVAALAGVAGVVVGTITAVRAARAWSAAVGAVLAAVITVDLGSVTVVAFAGYTFGCVAVIAGLITIAVMLVRKPRLGLVLLIGLVAVVVVAAVWAGLTVDGIADFANAFAGALARQWGTLAITGVVLASSLLWAATAVTGLRAGGRPTFARWLVRHRRVLTVMAALGPLPYAVARASWLTPWPLFGPAAGEMTPAVLVTGLILGSGAVAAGILTLGLILPWGRVFPRWIPVIGGRDVPVTAAAVPGFAAAGILIVAATPMFTMTVGDGESALDALMVNLVLPLWFWGPMLLLAVWAYVEWRAAENATGDAALTA